MRRREFIFLVGAAAVAWSFASHAQQTKPVIGYLATLGHRDRPYLAEAFRRGLSEAGFVEGRNVVIEYRFGENQADRLPGLAADLVRRKVAVIAATGGNISLVAAIAATKTIPIVFVTGRDPVAAGFVASLNRPGGNVTGVSFFATELTAKGLGLMHEFVPHAAVIGLLVNPNTPETAREPIDAQKAARGLGLQLRVVKAGSSGEIDAAFNSLSQQGVGALLVGADPFFSSRRQQIVALAARHAIPAMYFNREFVNSGGLMSYGNDIPDVYRRVGIYTGRILKGAAPADLPVDRATRFEFVINLKTAKALGLTVPATLFARVDKVIE
jgi:putative ABC transport system substrate-binding protein